MDISQELNKKRAQFKELESQLSDPGVLRDPKRLKTVGQEYNALKTLMELGDQYEKTVREMEEAQALLEDGDPSMKEMAEQELLERERELPALKEALEVALIPPDPLDKNNIIVEIRAGTGGDEAALFAADLFRMYARYAERQDWSYDIISQSQNDLGGLKEIQFLVKGDGVYGRLKYESGVHRVQRIPTTEKAGRVHTSTATVAVLPEVEDADIELDPKDLKIEATTSSGHGGQSVNTTYSAIRMTHIPTGITVQCQDERSQVQNKARAMTVMRARVFDYERQKRQAERSEQRRSQIGTGERSEKIRTYNYPQDRITDHRINENFHNIPGVMDGDLDEMIMVLKKAAQV